MVATRHHRGISTYVLWLLQFLWAVGSIIIIATKISDWEQFKNKNLMFYGAFPCKYLLLINFLAVAWAPSQARRQGGFQGFWKPPLGGQYLIINIMGGIHTCKTVWARLVNHTMKQLQPSTTNKVCLTTANIVIQTVTRLCLMGSWSDSLYYIHIDHH